MSDDVISRQAAIDVLNKHSVLFEFHLPHEFYEVKEELHGLPSAQPEIIRCKDCKHWTDENEGLCDIWDHYISNDEFFCGCGERRKDDEH